MGDPLSPPDLTYEQHWKALERVFPGVGFIFDQDGHYIDVISSDDTHPLLYEDPDELRGKTLHEVLPGDHADYFLAWIQRTLDTDEVNTIQYRLDVRAGTRWFEAYFVPLPPTDDESAYVQVLTRDVTGRKRREYELEEQKRRFEAVFEDPNILVGLLEPDGTLLDVNRTALEYLDADRGDVTGTPFWETPWFTGDEALQTEVRQLTRQAAAGEYVEFDLDLSDAVGQELVISGVFRPVTDDDGEVVSLVVSDRDVTRRIRREQELQRSERRFEAVFNDPHVLIGILDADGTVDRINRTALDLVDAELADLAGEPFWATPWWAHSDELQRDLRQWIGRATDGEYVEFEAEHYTVTGERVLVDGFLRPVVDEEGEVVSVIVSAHDVTSRTRKEQRLQVLHRILRHNLRNSLNTIGGYAEELRARLEALPAADELEAMAQIIEAEGTELATLVEKIQQVRRIERAGSGETIAVETLLADVAAALQGTGSTVSIDVAAPATGIAVPRTMEVVVFEAVENALEHHDRECGAPTIELSAEVESDAEPPQVTLVIADDGPGIPKSEIDPLETGGETALRHTSRVGLWLMKWTVESEGGELGFVANTPRGSAVEITLPCPTPPG